VAACTVHNDIPSALKLLEEGDILGGAAKFRETSTLPETCSRLCPQESLCEGDFVVGFAIRPDGIKQAPVAIGRLESFITNSRREQLGDFPVATPLPSTGRRAAIIGNGSAGLTVAKELQLRGHHCSVYDMWPEPGGVLRYGIPNFKMKKDLLEEKLTSLRALGFEFVSNTRIGTDITFERLHDELGFDVVFVGTGVGVGNLMQIQGEELGNIYQATDFLVCGNLEPHELPEEQREPPYVGKQAVIIGGRDTSMDCVRTAIRLGAERVICVYRRTENEMLGRSEERTHARLYLTTPLRFIGDAAGNVTSVELIRMELSEPDSSGRRRPVPIEGSNFTVPDDSVAIAIGYGADAVFTEAAPFETNLCHLIEVDEQAGQTNIPYVFAGDDAVQGADLGVTAIADGKRAAHCLHTYLSRLGGTEV
jgi:glutamate synthase (NADPH/NADH) small chain